MRVLKAIALLSFAGISTTASACFMHFEAKVMQDNVQYGECSCDGRVIGTGTFQQCYDATQGAKNKARFEEAQAKAEKVARELMGKETPAPAPASAASSSPSGSLESGWGRSTPRM